MSRIMSFKVLTNRAFIVILALLFLASLSFSINPRHYAAAVTPDLTCEEMKAMPDSEFYSLPEEQQQYYYVNCPGAVPDDDEEDETEEEVPAGPCASLTEEQIELMTDEQFEQQCSLLEESESSYDPSSESTDGSERGDDAPIGPTHAAGSTPSCPILANSVYSGTGGNNVIVRSFVNCVTDDDRIGNIEVKLDSLDSNRECDPSTKKTNALKVPGYGRVIFTSCPHPLEKDKPAKTYVVTSIKRDGYHVKDEVSPTRIGTRVLVYDNKTPIIRIVMEKDIAVVEEPIEHPYWWYNTCDSTGVAGNPEMCG